VLCVCVCVCVCVLVALAIFQLFAPAVVHSAGTTTACCVQIVVVVFSTDYRWSSSASTCERERTLCVSCLIQRSMRLTLSRTLTNALGLCLCVHCIVFTLPRISGCDERATATFSWRVLLSSHRR
jgi:hypothetical protein